VVSIGERRTDLRRRGVVELEPDVERLVVVGQATTVAKLGDD